MAASAASTVPAWVCGLPRWSCTNTSNGFRSPSAGTCKSPSFGSSSRSRNRDTNHLRYSLGRRQLAAAQHRPPDPLPLFVGKAPQPHALLVQRAVALDHPVELIPIRLTEAPMPGLFIEADLRIFALLPHQPVRSLDRHMNLETQVQRRGHEAIDEALP